MRTAVQWTKCWLLLTTISNIYSTADVGKHGTTVSFDGLEPGKNSLELEENNYINFTVHINDQNVFQIKISQKQNNLTVDLCKFILKTVCEVSDSSNASSLCQCINNHTVQFLKKASSSDSGLYTWKWLNGKTLDEHRAIFIKVGKKGNPSDDAASGAKAATTICVLLIVVGTATAGLVFWMRNKANFSIEVQICGRYYRWRGSDHAKNNQVNGQFLSNVDNHHSGNYSHDPNYTDDNEQDPIQHYDPNYDDINSTYACVMKKGKSQSTEPTTPRTNSKDTSQPLDPYYSDIKEPTISHDYENNHTNDTEHDKSHNYDPNYTDVNDHEASKPPDPDYSDVNQPSSLNYDPNYTDVKEEENSQPDDPTYAQVKKRNMIHPDHSTDAQVKTEDTIKPDDVYYDEVPKQEAGLAVDTTYPKANKQEMKPESGITYSLKDKQNPASAHNPNYVQRKEDATEIGGFYNHLHDIHQHVDPNYDHIESSTRKAADPTFQQVRGHNGLSYPNVKRENAIQKEDMNYDHIKQQDLGKSDKLSHVKVNKQDTMQLEDNYDHLVS